MPIRSVSFVSLALALVLSCPLAAQKAPSPTEDPGGPSLLERKAGEEAPRKQDAQKTTLRVLALARVEGSRGGFRLLELAGEAGILVDEMNGAGTLRKGPVFRMWGRIRNEEQVLRFRDRVAESSSAQILWLAWAAVPAGATEPVPLSTVVWSPLLYPSKASTMTRGPGGARRYYLEPGSAAVLESTNEGKDFRTAFSAGRVPEFVEGGAGLDLTKIFWRAKVSSWIDKQEDLRRSGYEKYGPLLEPQD